jgi:hypothetical protein
MHAKDAEPHAFLGLTGHLDLMASELDQPSTLLIADP